MVGVAFPSFSLSLVDLKLFHFWNLGDQTTLIPWRNCVYHLKLQKRIPHLMTSAFAIDHLPNTSDSLSVAWRSWLPNLRRCILARLLGNQEYQTIHKNTKQKQGTMAVFANKNGRHLPYDPKIDNNDPGHLLHGANMHGHHLGASAYRHPLASTATAAIDLRFLFQSELPTGRPSAETSPQHQVIWCRGPSPPPSNVPDSEIGLKTTATRMLTHFATYLSCSRLNASSYVVNCVSLRSLKMTPGDQKHHSFGVSLVSEDRIVSRQRTQIHTNTA